MWRGHGVQTSGPLYTTTGGVNNNNASQIENFFRMGDSSVNARSRGTNLSNFWPTVHVYSEGKKPLGPTYTCTQ